MSASFGYELNPLTLTEEERAQVKQQVETYKNDFAPLVVGGEFYRLTDPFVKDDCGWMFVSPEQDKAVVVYARQLIRPSVRAGPGCGLSHPRAFLRYGRRRFDERRFDRAGPGGF